jgi:DNA-binding response OmpR family regulator
MPNRIFIIEDEEILAQALASSLKKEGFLTSYATTGEIGQAEVESKPEDYHLLILDWMLPDKSGPEISQALRSKKINVPILLLTGKDSIENKVEALRSGADDYLTKPFALAELVARVHSLMRRPRNILPETLNLGNLVLDTEKKKIFSSGKEIPLTLKEFAILEYLMRHPNKVITREQLLDHVWDYNFDSFSNIVDVHINNLRKKIMSNGGGTVLETIRGVGYCARVLN